jgi:uncharacterized RmlC-like cupin family protein
MTGRLRSAMLIQNCDLQEPPQGAAYRAAISDQTVGSEGLWFGLITVAPGHRTKAHTHPHETGIYVTKGAFDLYSGDDMSETVTVAERDFALIPRDVPHVAVNRSDTEPVFAIVARSNPAHVEAAQMMPELDAEVP